MELIVRFDVNEDPASDKFDSPDNITVSPWGGLLLCADGEGVQHLYSVSPDGQASMFARNARDLAEETGSEFTGATFSADGETLFVNLQYPGVTFAITGPWEPSARHLTATRQTGAQTSAPRSSRIASTSAAMSIAKISAPSALRWKPSDWRTGLALPSRGSTTSSAMFPLRPSKISHVSTNTASSYLLEGLAYGLVLDLQAGGELGILGVGDAHPDHPPLRVLAQHVHHDTDPAGVLGGPLGGVGFGGLGERRR